MLAHQGRAVCFRAGQAGGLRRRIATTPVAAAAAAAIRDHHHHGRRNGAYYSSSAAAFTSPQLPPKLPPAAVPPTLVDDNVTTTSTSSSNNKKAAQKKSRWAKLWDRYSLGGQQYRIQTAESLFQAAMRQAADSRWYGPGRVPRDFRSRHALLTMHVWFLHKRLIADQHDQDQALLIQEELFNILWDDTTCRIRQQGVHELMVNKNLLKVQQYTFLHLTHYDHAYTAMLDKPADRLRELRSIVWQHVLVRDPDAEHRTDQLDRIAWYVEANYQNIVMAWPDEHYRAARVAWVDLPAFDGMRDTDGTVLPGQAVHEDDVLPAPWVENITLKGIPYWWNETTRQSSWTRPT